jgi:LytR cell envelope-related transcriptional attenuator
VEQTAHHPDVLGEPWRRATLITGTIATVEFVLLVVAGLILLARPLAQHARTATGPVRHAAAKPKPAAVHHTVPAQPQPKPRAPLARARTQVMVLNGNGRSHAASDEASLVRARGYPVTSVGNAPRSIPQSVVMYRPGYRPEALRLARDLGLGLVAPLDGMRVASLHGAKALVVLGSS